jgi:DNA-binding NarL/FixJ family response regulator
VAPQVALMARFDVLPELAGNFRPISTVFEIGRSDDLVLLYGPGMGGLAGSLNRSGLAGRRMPPVAVLARTLDQRDITDAFGHGPVSYCLEEGLEQNLDDLVRLTCQRQYCISPEVLRILLVRDRGSLDTTRHALTGRERDIMNLLSDGNNVTEIADQLKVSQKTIRNNLTNIFTKLRARRQAEAILIWRGLL